MRGGNPHDDLDFTGRHDDVLEGNRDAVHGHGLVGCGDMGGDERHGHVEGKRTWDCPHGSRIEVCLADGICRRTEALQCVVEPLQTVPRTLPSRYG